MGRCGVIVVTDDKGDTADEHDHRSDTGTGGSRPSTGGRWLRPWLTPALSDPRCPLPRIC